MVAALACFAALTPPPQGTSAARATFELPPMSSIAMVKDVVQRQSARAVAIFTRAPAPKGLDHYKSMLGYDLNAVFDGQGDVPRITLASLPHDLGTIRETEERKALFFKTVLPLVLQVNEQILEDRDRLTRLAAEARSGHKPSAEDRLWLAVMAERYDTRRGDIQALLKRHDIVPPSLALAQGATESAWGTSRFVREGNAIFGQWTFSDDHEGLVPQRRGEDKTHRIRAFDSLYQSVMSYATNLNRHPAYEEFRQMRADMRARGQEPDGARLATTLYRYSERGAAYVDELLIIMNGNTLTRLDSAKLSVDKSGPLG